MSGAGRVRVDVVEHRGRVELVGSDRGGAWWRWRCSCGAVGVERRGRSSAAAMMVEHEGDPDAWWSGYAKGLERVEVLEGEALGRTEGGSRG